MTTYDDQPIRDMIERWAVAFRAKDIEGVMAIYAPTIVSFDLVPPLQYIGAEAYRAPWEETFRTFRAPLGYEVHHLKITMTEDMALSHSLNRMSGTLEDGSSVDFWLRWTACYRTFDGAWLVVHEHVSAPFEFETGKAALDLTP